MSIELTYPGLRNVLEYLEPNKRLHIAARSPALRQFDKSIPIHIDKLQFENEGFSINKISCSLRAKSEFLKSNDKRPQDDLLPGDIFVGLPDEGWEHQYIAIRFKRGESWDRNRMRFENRAPDGLGMKPASKQMADFLLGYKSIYVDNLRFEVHGALRLPEGFKVHPRVFDVRQNDFHPFMPIIDLSCAPLKELGLHFLKITNLQHPLVKTARKLVIHNPDDLFDAQKFEKLSNKHVEFDIELEDYQIIEIVEIWKNCNKAIGATVTFVKYLGYNNIDMLNDVPMEMNGRLKELKVDGSQQAYACVSIPMSSTSEINIYEVSEDEVRMEVMPNGTACSSDSAAIEKSNAVPKDKMQLVLEVVVVFIFIIIFVAIVVGIICDIHKILN